MCQIQWVWGSTQQPALGSSMQESDAVDLWGTTEKESVSQSELQGRSSRHHLDTLKIILKFPQIIFNHDSSHTCSIFLAVLWILSWTSLCTSGLCSMSSMGL